METGISLDPTTSVEDDPTIWVLSSQSENYSAIYWEDVDEYVHKPSLWLTQEEIDALPISGIAYNNVLNWALSNLNADISDQDNKHNTQTYAQALLCARDVNPLVFCARAEKGIKDAIGTEAGGRTLALGRNLLAYVLAADLIGYRDEEFTNWLDEVRTKNLPARAGMQHLQDHALRDPANWGNHARASMIATALYLEDVELLDQLANRFHDWTGRSSDDWEFRIDWSWHADPDNPLGINPSGATINGHNVDGVMPDDQRRGGEFKWPPAKTGYSWEALQGVVVSAELLHRAGYPAWEWESQAVMRSVYWLYNTIFDDGLNDPAEGDDLWQPWLINYAYGTEFHVESPTSPGKNIGFTDWTHGGYTEVSIKNSKMNIPLDAALKQNYPNPFNPSTIIEYVIPEAGAVQLEIFDILGRRIAILVNEVQQPGIYRKNFNASNFSSGIYLYRLHTSYFLETRQMLLVQ